MRTWLQSYRHYSAGAQEATQQVLESFKKRRRQLIRLSLVSMGLTFLSVGIVGTQLFYPFHVVIGVTIYLLSFLPLARRIYLSRNTWQTYRAYTLTTGFVKKERRRLVGAILILVCVALFLWLRPLDADPFEALSDEEIAALVTDDLYRSVTAMDYLETRGNELLQSLGSAPTSPTAIEDVANTFTAFLEAVAYSESLTDVHRYFAEIPYAYWDTRLESFLIANSLYAKKYELVHRIMVAANSNEQIKTSMDQFIPEIGRAGIYSEMVMRFYEPKTRIRLTGGYYYQRLFIGDRPRNDASFSLLRDKAHESYRYLRANFATTLAHTPTVIGDAVERKMFEGWFPIQKNVATAMGRAIISTRGKEGLITASQAREMGAVMRPGDIMLQRRNWHVSNVGIPGFWTHAALYTGTLDDMDEYFASEFPIHGYDSMSAYLEATAPAAFAAYSSLDSAGDRASVLEAIEPGVVAQTLPVSADADFVVVLRPELTKNDVMQAIIKAFANYGKPYDFNFDFSTRDSMVCSELVYDAYLERLPNKRGLHMDTSVVNGRTIVSPFDIAEKYAAERTSSDRELTFVYFLRGNEERGVATIADEQAFVESLSWSKFSFLQPKE